MKKIFTAVILAVFILSAQIAAAADVDWNSVPRINSKAQLATYIENGRRRGQKVFYFTFPSMKIHNDQEREDFRLEIAQSNAIPYCLLDVDGGFGTGRFIFTITRQDFIGTRVANAYLSGDISKLTPDELELYRKALPIVNEAKKYSSEVKKARYIHDELCRRVNYESHTNEDARGALVIGVTNCKGYSDAFYMLGRMAGLNVRRIGGKIEGDGHVWNTITYSDGKTYCVDVAYCRFNLTLENMRSKYSCQWEAITNLQ